MGAVIPVTDKTKSDTRSFTFKADSLKNEIKVRVIADGELLAELTTVNGALEYRYELTPIHTVSFTRVEIWNEEGRCILLTNPIYIVNTDNFSGQIPECRIYGGAI